MEAQRDLTGVRSVGHQEHAQRAQVDVFLVFVGHQSPVHVSGLHTGHLGCRGRVRDRQRLLALNLSDRQVSGVN